MIAEQIEVLLTLVESRIKFLNDKISHGRGSPTDIIAALDEEKKLKELLPALSQDYYVALGIDPALVAAVAREGRERQREEDLRDPQKMREI